ncbi:MAG: hypothetical protein ABIH83_02665 [Candidatus Micrarchaeota archaeon]
MKTPICKNCAWEGQLCLSCQQKLEKNSISQLDVEVSKILYKINETHNITEASFSKALDFGNVVVLLTEGEAGILIGKSGKVVSAISSALGRKVRIVKYSGDFKRSIQDMLAPARLLGINTSWSGGEEKMKVRLPASDKEKLYVDESTLRSVIKTWMGKDVDIIFE